MWCFFSNLKSCFSRCLGCHFYAYLFYGDRLGVCCSYWWNHSGIFANVPNQARNARVPLRGAWGAREKKTKKIKKKFGMTQIFTGRKNL